MTRYSRNILLSLFILSGCTSFDSVDPYEKTLCDLYVRAEYPADYRGFVREGVKVVAEEINLSYKYYVVTDADGVAHFTIPKGLYRVNISDMYESDIFNGTSDRVHVSGESEIRLSLIHSRAGSIVIREIYSGGCKRLPQEGNYVADQYIILHNNDFRVQYLDSLCLGTLSPFNSNSNNVWISKDPVSGETLFQNFVPVVQCVWQFHGSGHDFPLQPGEDAVIAMRGAIDHTVQYPLSVNLNKPGYFVCYNNTYFTNTAYHPTPGNNISSDHILDVVIKTGQANAYTLSNSSPAVVIFRSQGITIQDYVRLSDSVKPTPGDSHNPIVAVPQEWVVDAVEVFNGTTSANTKRLSPSLDAGYVILTDTYLGHTVCRRTDEVMTESAGYEVLMDTNNSSADMYERQIQSLHE